MVVVLLVRVPVVVVVVVVVVVGLDLDLVDDVRSGMVVLLNKHAGVCSGKPSAARAKAHHVQQASASPGVCALPDGSSHGG